MNTIKILVADDHRVLADGLKALLETEPDFQVEGIAQNGEEVLKLLEEKQVDVVLMDISMPVMDGLETTAKITSLFPKVKVLILTTHDDGGLVNSVFENGASGYILKNAPGEELVRSIRSVAVGQKVISPHLTSKMIDFIQRGKHTPDPKAPKVTRRELEIIQLIAQELTTKKIAAKLFLSPNTIVTHKRNLFVKFDVKNSVGLIRAAIEMGIVND